MRLLYGIIDSYALNAFVIFNENVSSFGEHKKEKRQKFLKELALALIIPHARQRFEVQQTLQDVKQVIRSCGILPAPSAAPRIHPASFSTAQEVLHLSPDQRTTKPNSSVMSATNLCARITANGCTTSARSRS